MRREFEAVQQVKTIRRPFLLCLERAGLVVGELVMVMGLAEQAAPSPPPRGLFAGFAK